jgi:hypothetical protein
MNAQQPFTPQMSPVRSVAPPETAVFTPIARGFDGSVQLVRRDDTIIIGIETFKNATLTAHEFVARYLAITVGITVFMSTTAAPAMPTSAWTVFTRTFSLMDRCQSLMHRGAVSRRQYAITIAVHPVEHFSLQGADFGQGDIIVLIGIGCAEHHHDLSGAMITATAMLTAATRTPVLCIGSSGKNQCAGQAGE